MTIRDLTLEDFDAVNEIFMQIHDLHVENRPDIYRSIRKPRSTKAWDYEAGLDDSYMLMLGAEVDGRIVGFCIAELQPAIGSAFVPCMSAHIRNLAVHEDYRRLGIGTVLYQKTLLLAKARGAVRVDLKVYSFNEEALEFYQSLGMTFQSYTLEQNL